MRLVMVLAGVAALLFGARPGPPDPVADIVTDGAGHFVRSFQPEHGLGPLFNAQSCVACHDTPRVGGMGAGTSGTALRVGRIENGVFDAMELLGGPVARAHSIGELGSGCSVQPGIPAGANVTSVRNAPALFGLGLIDAIPDEEILAEAERQQGDARVKGRPHLIVDADGRSSVGHFGWKAQIGSLEAMVADAFRTELGITSPLASSDFASGCIVSQGRTTDDDGGIVQSVVAYIASLEPPISGAERSHADGAATFRVIGCGDCHTPALSGPSGPVPLYSDLLLHDVGPALDDAVIQGLARGRDWRTTPLWGLRMRQRYLHDARAESIPAAITAHAGEASAAVAAYRSLTDAERESLVAFLRAL